MAELSPVEDLSLGPAPTAPGNNPLGTLGTFANVQNALNQNRLFQQTFAARQRLGEIIATAPDAETGWTQAMQDPQVAPFAGEAYANFRQGQVALQQYANEQQVGRDSGLKIVLGALGAGAADPSQLAPNINARLAMLPEQNRNAVAPAAMSIVQSLTAGLPKDPALARAEYNKRLVGLSVGSGVMNPQGIDSIFGSPTTINTGGGTVSGTQAPGYAGGGFTGNSLTPNVPPPQVNVTAGGGARTLGGYAPSPLGGGPAQSAPGNVTPPAPPAIAGNGTPLKVDPASIPRTQLDPSGQPIRDPATQKNVENQLDSFNKAQPMYDMAANSIARLDAVDQNIQTLAKGGGWLTPGAGGQLRANLANVINTASAIVNPSAPPPIDVGKTAAAQETIKDNINLGFQLAHTMFGGGREALGTIQNAIAAVPGLDNTPLGGRLLAGVLKAGAQWQLDQRRYKQMQMNQTRGDLTGSDEAFARLYPPTSYVEPVLKQFGLGPKGFESRDAVKAAFQQGLLGDPSDPGTLKESAKIIRDNHL